MNRPLRRCAILSLALSACVVGPDYVEPEVAMPDQWHRDLTRGLETGDAPLHSWWTLLQDDQLNELIQRVGQGNLDLRIAFGRLMEARALLGIARGERMPQVQGNGRYTRFEFSDALVPLSSNDSVTSLGVDASWEIDVWGRITRSIESADAGLQASVEDYRDVLVILYSEVAFTYLELRATQARIRYAKANVDLQDGSVQLTRDRFEAEISSELDVRQAELNREATASIIPTLEIAEGFALHRLAVLLGEHPGALQDELTTETPIPAPPDQVLVSMPAEIVRQRPDIRSAERQLAAQTARIGMATAELYPQFSISGSFGYDASSGSMFALGNQAWSFGPSFQWNLFNGGRVRANIEAEKARTEQLLAGYEQTVLLALEEVENALLAYARELGRRDTLQRSVEAAQKSVELVLTLYRTGVTDFQNVLNMQRLLVQQQDQLASSEGLVVQNLVALYKALGGGWQPPPEEEELVAAADTNNTEQPK